MIGNLGMGEIILIAGLALVVIGPEKFPEFAKIALRAFRDARGYVDDIKREMSEELRPIKDEVRQLSKYNPEDYVDSLTKAVTSLDDDETGASEDAPDETGASEDAPDEAGASEDAPDETGASGEARDEADGPAGSPEQVDVAAADDTTAIEDSPEADTDGAAESPQRLDG